MNAMFSIVKKIFPFFILLFFSFNLIAADKAISLNKDKVIVTLISKENNAEFPKMIEAMLKAKLPPPLEVRYIDYAKVRSKEQLCQVCLNANLIVTIGFESTEATLDLHPKRPILSTLVRKNSYDKLVDQYQKTADEEHQPNVTAVYLDHPIKRHLELIRNVVPDKNAVPTTGVLLGPNSKACRKELEEYAKQLQIPLYIAEVKEGQDLLSVLEDLLKHSKILLAIPDSVIYNQHTAKIILMHAMQSKIPVIAFSKSYVEMGALAGLYSDPEQVAIQTVDKIMIALKNPDKLNEPEYMKDYKIVVNDQLSKVFGFPKQALSAITRAMLEAE